MAAIAVISTWVGFEISLIGDALTTAAAQTTDPVLAAQLTAGAQNPFNIFLHSIPFLFYPILALVFVAMVAFTRRDFGAMHRAEIRARAGLGVLAPDARPAADVTGNQMEPAPGVPHRWYNAVLPVLTVIVIALIGIIYTGAQGSSLWQIVGGADPFKTLIWASFAGNVVAIGLTVAQRILPLAAALDAWISGMRAMLLAIIILVLAWALGGVTEALGTGPYLSGVLQNTLPIGLLPVVVFIIAAAISFATGTSWGTMAILFPIVVPLAVAMGAGVGFQAAGDYSILLGVISSVLAGSIFGDHCSPISDTTVMSSMASACDHVDHVRTQLPYALTVAIVGMLVGDIPTAYGLSPWISLALGCALLYLILRVLGKRVPDERFAISEEPVLAGSGAD
jgi:Na+/H+ antiporter NhaC